MKKLFIHIGHQKCGSTTIQNWFAKHQEHLDQLGIHYIRAGRVGSAHYPLSDQLTRPALGKQRDHFVDLKHEIAACPANNFLISAESFVLTDFTPHVEKLRNKLPRNLEIHIVLIVRKQYDWLPSLWSQAAKNGNTLLSFDEWYSRKFPNQFNADYRSLSELWLQVFQSATLHILPFEDMIASSDGLIASFMKELELPLPPEEILQDSSAKNISPTYETTLFCQNFFAALREHNLRLYQKLAQKGSAVARANISRMLQKFIALKKLDGGAKKWMTLERKREVFEYYKDSNYDIAQRFSSPEKFKRFLAPPTEDIINIDYQRIATQSDLLPEAILFVMSELIEDKYFKPQQ